LAIHCGAFPIAAAANFDDAVTAIGKALAYRAGGLIAIGLLQRAR
jgi:hypothetical protein